MSYKPHGNHKVKTCNRYIKKDKGNQYKQLQKIIKLKWKRQREEERNKHITKSQKTINKMATVSPYLSIITLNVNRLNSPIKRCRVAEEIKEQDPITCCL